MKSISKLLFIAFLTISLAGCGSSDVSGKPEVKEIYNYYVDAMTEVGADAMPIKEWVKAMKDGNEDVVRVTYAAYLEQKPNYMGSDSEFVIDFNNKNLYTPVTIKLTSTSRWINKYQIHQTVEVPFRSKGLDYYIEDVNTTGDDAFMGWALSTTDDVLNIENYYVTSTTNNVLYARIIEKTKVTFWHSLSEEQTSILSGIVTNFETKNKTIKVVTKRYESQDKLNVALKESIANQKNPTMSMCVPDYIADFVEDKNIVELSTYKSGIEYEEGQAGFNDFLSVSKSNGTGYYKVGMYSAPFLRTNDVLYYNKTMFEENHWDVPTTWASLGVLCQRTSNLDKSLCGIRFETMASTFISMIKQNEGQYLTNDSIITYDDHYCFNNSRAKEMADMIKKIVGYGYGIINNTSDKSSAFKSGVAVMAIDSMENYDNYYSPDFETGVAIIPGSSTLDAFESQEKQICVLANTTDPQKTAAWRFYQALTSTTALNDFCQYSPYLPTRDSTCEGAFKTYLNSNLVVGEDDEEIGKNQILRDAQKVSQDKFLATFVTPCFKGSYNCRLEMAKLINSICYTDVSIDDAFDRTYQKCISYVK